VNKKCETETQLVTTSWQHAVAGNNCLQILMYRKLRHDCLDWQTERVDGSFELLGNYKRDSAFGTVGAGQPLP